MLHGGFAGEQVFHFDYILYVLSDYCRLFSRCPQDVSITLMFTPLFFRLSRLLHKHMFEEAEKFAITFDLDLEVSVEQKSNIYWTFEG